MRFAQLISMTIPAALVLSTPPAAVVAQGQPAVTFSAGVDLVRVSAVVRDRKGRVVRDLTARDFEVIDRGRVRPIVGFQTESPGISLALLFDVSGSMEGQAAEARESAQLMLSRLDTAQDEAAVFAFDTRLEQVAPFTPGLRALPPELAELRPFGATSLHDAIAETARRLAGREGRRSAVVVFTDGNDNASRLTPGEVSGIASAIDVPVYVVGVVSAIDDPGADIGATGGRSVFENRLADLAMWTGGAVFVASSTAERSRVAEHVMNELRHQYLLAFEASNTPGWHPLVVRVRNQELVVRARGGYIAGQSRPTSE